MKILLNKELRLAAAPVTYVFLLFTLTTMIPDYPILTGAMFVCLGLFYSFLRAREANDILYTVLLPVKKSDTVKAKYLFCCCVELAAFAAMALLTALRMTLLRDMPVYVNNVMMPANPVFLAFVLLIFAAFNGIFLGGFFETANNIGKPFAGFLAAAFLLAGAGETLHHIPILRFLGQASWPALGWQCIALAVAALLFALITWLSYRQARENFEALEF